MVQILIMLHVVLSLALLGALTHQAFSVARRKPIPALPTIVNRFRNVNASAFTTTIIVLFFIQVVVGGFLYPRYRIDVRTTLEDLQLRAANGFFEIKEHFAAVGLGLLPAYWLFWRQPFAPEDDSTRKYLTWLLTFIAWWNFLVGEYLNNIKGLYP